MTGGNVSLQPIGIARSNSSSSQTGGASLSSLVGNSKDYRIHRSMPLSEPLRGLPPMARPVDASYYSKPRAVLPPVSATSTASTVSSTGSTGSGMYYRQRSDSFDDVLFSHGRRSSFSTIGGDAPRSSSRRSFSGEPVTPFDEHLQAIYAGTFDDNYDGLAFFESHGYYDVDDANTVEMFRQNFGLQEKFWEKAMAADETRVDDAFYDPSASTADLTFFHSVGERLYRRHRTYSGRFQLVDDDGNTIDEETQWEIEREARIKAKSVELDEYDLQELEHEHEEMVKAILVIRLEKSQFQEYFYQAFRDEDAQFMQYTPAPSQVHRARRTTIATSSVADATALATIPPPMSSNNVQLPPYCGNVFLLKDTIPYLLRSWHKRWFYLDFNTGVIMMYKRSYWKSPRGMLDLRTATKVERMNQCDFRIEFRDQPMLLVRTKTAEEAELWVNLLKFAKHHVGSSPAPQLTQHAHTASPEMRASVLKIGKKKGGSKNGAMNQVEMLAMLLSSSASKNATNAASSAITNRPTNARSA
uniref:PH domain-containing protein n=1 Tax=Globisporangium ultimum (strain ATCC 200006 / CBS 805.95 / DAOM BR144) TaxID=431595 RepID=K3WTA5_GLOUD